MHLCGDAACREVHEAEDVPAGQPAPVYQPWQLLTPSVDSIEAAVGEVTISPTLSMSTHDRITEESRLALHLLPSDLADQLFPAGDDEASATQSSSPVEDVAVIAHAEPSLTQRIFEGPASRDLGSDKNNVTE